VIFVFDQFGVGVSVEQLIQLGAVACLHEKDPAVAIGVFVNGFGLVVEGFVDLDNFAGNRGLNVRSGLDRFDHSRTVTGFHCRTDLGKFNVNQVAELALRVVGDANTDQAVLFDTGPLVGLEEFQIAGNLAHGRVQSS
jgi:hypothetical protein